MSESICPETGKTQYSSSEAKRQLARSNENGRPMTRTYKCRWCELYHLTSKPEARNGRPLRRRRSTR